MKVELSEKEVFLILKRLRPMIFSFNHYGGSKNTKYHELWLKEQETARELYKKLGGKEEGNGQS
jgi:hypothetical protein